METRKILFTVIVKKWWDKINGNTYHSVRCVRHKDGALVVGSFRYGYGTAYEHTALDAMNDAGWLPKKYTKANVHTYARENNHPILWVESYGLKRDCIENGEL